MQMINPLPTMPHSYKKYACWVDGNLPKNNQPGEYRYYIRRKPNEEPIASVDTFPLVTAAHLAARAAIDAAEKFSGVQEMQVLATGNPIEETHDDTTQKQTRTKTKKPSNKRSAPAL